MQTPYDRGYRQGHLCRLRCGILPPNKSGYPAGSQDGLDWWRGYDAGWLDTCAQIEREAAAAQTPRQEMSRG